MREGKAEELSLITLRAGSASGCNYARTRFGSQTDIEPAQDMIARHTLLEKRSHNIDQPFDRFVLR